MKKKKQKKIILTILFVFFLISFMVSAVKVISILLDYKKDADYNRQLQEQVIIRETDSEDNHKTPGPTHNVVVNPDEDNEDTEKPLKIDFEKLKAINANCFCWLQLPGTVISYPVVYTDDNSYYLRRALDGTKLSSGTLFADLRNRHFGEDENFIIYGHHVQSGIMFAPLVKYKSQSFYDEHPFAYIITENGNWKLNFFAGIVVKADDGIYMTYLGNEDQYDNFVADARSRSTFKCDIIPEYGDRLVTLSTCSYEYENARYVLIGKLEKI